MTKLMLLNPPFNAYSMPVLSISMLTAYCKKKGIENVSQYDLNIEIVDTLLSNKTSEIINGEINKKKEG